VLPSASCILRVPSELEKLHVPRGAPGGKVYVASLLGIVEHGADAALLGVVCKFAVWVWPRFFLCCIDAQLGEHSLHRLEVGHGALSELDLWGRFFVRLGLARGVLPLGVVLWRLKTRVVSDGAS
jgi:hypothetical protein